MSQIVKHYEKNKTGRDFIVGDLHGYYDVLMKLLVEHIQFDFKNDRLFSVGDIIDRGPQCLDCLTLLNERWFHMVRGNHEQLMIDALTYSKENNKHDLEIYWAKCGGFWWQSFKEEEQKLIIEIFLEKLMSLPYIITVGGGDNRFNIVHSELPIAIQSDIDIDIIKDLDNITKDMLIWSRTIYNDLSRLNQNRSISKTYCGHTIVNQIFERAGHINIDTGLYYGDGKLTIVEANTLRLPIENNIIDYWQIDKSHKVKHKHINRRKLI